jgi:calcineurin-like phosphoesterase family protein
MTESYIEEIIKEQLMATPKKGFNVCTYDDYARLGERLTVVKHVNTEEEAREIAKKLDGEKVYIYGESNA